MLTHHLAASYVSRPSEEDLFVGFSLAIWWSVPRLLSYLQFHLLEKIKSGTIHPMLTLAIARRAGLPWLIPSAVKSLAQGNRQIAEWMSDSVLRWATAVEVGVIAGMKEGLWKQRWMMAAVPNAHHGAKCLSDEQVKNHCESTWAIHWLFKIQKYVVGKHSESSTFAEIKRIIQESPVLGMDGDCREKTVTSVAGSDLWKAEEDAIEAAIQGLMVEVALMDGPDGVKEIERID